MDSKFKQSLKFSQGSNYKQLISLFGGHRVKLNEPLRFYTFSKVGGNAEAFFIATTQKELIDIIRAARNLEIPYQVFGAGTKVMFSPGITPGLVIKNRTSGIKVSGVKGKVGQTGIGVEEALVEVETGVSLGRINQFLTSQKLPSVNFVSHPDATLGGSLLIESPLHPLIQSIGILENGEMVEINISDLKRDHLILKAVLKIKT